MIFTDEGYLKLENGSFFLSWKLILEEEFTGKEVVLEPGMGMEYSCRKKSSGLLFFWKGGWEKRFFVEVFWKNARSICSFRFRYGGLSGRCRVKKILFPFVILPEYLEKGSLFLPLVPDCRREFSPDQEFFLEESFLSLPFTFFRSLEEEVSGVYLGVESGKGTSPGVQVMCDGKGRRSLALIHYVPGIPTARKKYLLPCENTIAFPRKDEDILQYFRAFLEKNPLWLKRRKYKKSPFDILWKWRSGFPLAESEKIIAELRRKKYSIAVLAEGLQEKEKEFFREKNISLILRDSLMQGKNMNEEEVKHSLILTGKGTPTPNLFMCLSPGTPLWKKQKSFVKELAEKKEYAGICAKDILTEEGNTFCSSPCHLHPPHSGSVRKENLSRFLTKLHKENSHFLLLAEGAEWELTSLLDGMILPVMQPGEGEVFIQLFSGVLPLYVALDGKMLPDGFPEGFRKKNCRIYLPDAFSPEDFSALMQVLPEKRG